MPSRLIWIHTATACFDPVWDAASAPAVHTSISFFLLNASSPNKEAALRFLNACAEQMDDSSAMRLFPGKGWHFNENAVAACREIAAHYCFGACARYIRILLSDIDAPGLIMDYCTGKSQITEDQVINTLDVSLSKTIQDSNQYAVP